MMNASIGDLAVSYTQRRRNVALKQDINRLTAELASGQISDTRKVLAGNYSYLTDIERKMTTLSGYSVATAEAAHYAGAMQTSLGQIGEITQDLSASLLATGTNTNGPSASTTASEARNALGGIVGRLNAQIAGRHMFSGTATDRAPLVDVDTLLTSLSSAMAGATTPDDMLAAAQAWFDDPAGFAASAYVGAADALAPFQLSLTEAVTLDVNATAPELRDSLRLTAVAALADDPSFAMTGADQKDLFSKVGKAMLFTQDDLISLQSRVGYAEARIDEITARNAAELTSLEYTKSALLSIDPFEAATRLEEAQFQLQSLYSVTVRMSQLSIVNFL
ncbi:flagellar hook-associated protein FlgL [Sulfitobacter sp. THAF37]|uniref:flagellin n=1 Tax=Sulfitobacter sp. THAF37 TaxID=2587855 RepID=UPI0012686649|nr:flagellin [Sulfitobacter sp. THAF37]QFT58386.1 flagellar hook-associated protein FlgL [Sulfitobacter sp. THAF37]